MKKINLLLIGLMLVGGIWGKAQEAYALQSPQINHLGQVVWHRHGGHDREIFLYKGKGEPIQLTDNEVFDVDPPVLRIG